jgi:hypothetical protein
MSFSGKIGGNRKVPPTPPPITNRPPLSTSQTTGTPPSPPPITNRPPLSTSQTRTRPPLVRQDAMRNLKGTGGPQQTTTADLSSVGTNVRGERAPRTDKLTARSKTDGLKRQGEMPGYRTGAKDARFDGAFIGAPKNNSVNGTPHFAGTDWTKMEGIKPNNGKPLTGGKCLFVNGIKNTVDSQARTMQSISNKLGCEVVGIHNSTHGMARDLGECVKDKMNVGTNGSHKTLRDAVYNHVGGDNYKQPLNIIAHSQGGIITSRAIRDARNQLRTEHPEWSPQQLNERMGHVFVQTNGGGAQRYPSGPHYEHNINRFDPVGQLPGIGGGVFGDAGKKGEVRHFEGGTHNMIKGYVDHLKPLVQ